MTWMKSGTYTLAFWESFVPHYTKHSIIAKVLAHTETGRTQTGVNREGAQRCQWLTSRYRRVEYSVDTAGGGGGVCGTALCCVVY